MAVTVWTIAALSCSRRQPRSTHAIVGLRSSRVKPCLSLPWAPSLWAWVIWRLPQTAQN